MKIKTVVELLLKENQESEIFFYHANEEALGTPTAIRRGNAKYVSPYCKGDSPIDEIPEDTPVVVVYCW